MQKDAKAPSADMEDVALAALAKAGNSEAFALLAARFSAVTKKLASRYYDIPDMETEDLLQEGLLGLLAAVRKYQPQNGEFFPFAVSCIKNRIISAVRKHLPVKCEIETAEPEETLTTIPLGQADPATLLVEQEEAARLYGKLRALLTDREYAVLLAHLGGDSYAQIANALSITAKAVDNALQRVRRKLEKNGFRPT